MDFNEIKHVGIGAAYKSAKILNDYFGSLNNIHKKGPTDLVTDADVASQKEIVGAIRAKFPDHHILAEEDGYHQGGSNDCQWIIDPLDGTTNFAHRIPIFCISIAFAVAGRTRVGIVLNPINGELFTAVEGQGAALNNQPISVSEQTDISESLLVTGFPYDFQAILHTAMQRFQKCLLAARGIRRLGAAALDLCYVACGRFEAFWEEGLQPWDTAAGALIAEAAGGRVTDFSGNPFSPDKKQILATNAHIHEAVSVLLNS
ncbi:MAG: inositol monophosphatase [Desulfobacterales bacterium]|nr:inositol monophosphatase [Desulfobacterales bacterium]